MQDVRLVAFYLTQFHPIAENDAWWGRGFTEWTNATKAQPLFDGHYQPHLPTDLGFYDLRLRQSRHDQIAMARQYGIDAFCYHYYWFSGVRLLHEPLDDMLADPKSDMPYCLCWANENWTRRWDAAENEILIEQKYRPTDDVDFIKSVVPHFKDPRYLLQDGAPILIVYRPQHMPDSIKSTNKWREYCRSVGIPRIHLICALTHGNLDYESYGFDAGVEFPPHHPAVASYQQSIDFYNNFHGYVFNYAELANVYLDRTYKNPKVYRSVFPSWDNTARIGPRAVIILNGTPANYEYWLSEAVRRSKQDRAGEESFVFINSWNEWAEGCHIEPDRKYGRGFLEATLRVKENRSTLTDFTDTGLPCSTNPPRSAEVAAPINESAPMPNIAAIGGLEEDPPPPPPPVSRQTVGHRSARVLRRAIGQALRPFPKARIVAVQLYHRYFERL